MPDARRKPLVLSKEMFLGLTLIYVTGRVIESHVEKDWDPLKDKERKA